MSDGLTYEREAFTGWRDGEKWETKTEVPTPVKPVLARPLQYVSFHATPKVEITLDGDTAAVNVPADAYQLGLSPYLPYTDAQLEEARRIIGEHVVGAWNNLIDTVYSNPAEMRARLQAAASVALENLRRGGGIWIQS